jgi:hypothetical protein
MSRLDSFIRRLQAQRACLEAAVALIAGLDGAVLELGLGNGRTFDHMRKLCPDREIFVFDRQVVAHPDCAPAADHLFLGELTETLPLALTRLGGRAALVHMDIGSGDEAASRKLAAAIAPMIRALMQPGGIVVSDQPLALGGLTAIPPPKDVKPGRYFLCRAS